MNRGERPAATGGGGKAAGAPQVRSHLSVAESIRDARPQLGNVRLVVVDGPTGAGKSYFAKRLALALRHAPVVHLDHLYEGWSGLATVGPRLESWVLLPLRNGLPGRHLVYDWRRGAYAEWREVPVAPCLVVEGTGAGQQPLDADATLRVWVEAPPGLCLARALARDGEHNRANIDAWRAAEAAHFAADDTRARADLVVDGASSLPLDPLTQFVELPRG